MNIVFFGTPELSAYVLDKLYISGVSIQAVVTQPDRKSGRGQQLSFPHVKDMAIKHGLQVLQSERFDRKLFSEIKDLGSIDLCVVVAYGCYIPTYFIEYMSSKILNIHFSLLPKYRGAAPVARAIMNGGEVTGVSIMEICKEMDAGDVLVQKKIEIEAEDNTETLSWKLAEEGASLLTKTLENYLSGKIKKIAQAEMGVNPTYAEKINPEEKIINWSEDAVTIQNQIRALYPWPVAESMLNNVAIKFIKAKAVLDKGASRGLDIGVIVDIDKKGGSFTIQTGNGLLLVEKVKPSGKKELSVIDFLNGYPLKIGMRFNNV
jgi:methionyl-tRNA formyltransferase